MPQAKREIIDMSFPIGGVVEGSAHGDQPPMTTWDCKNVIPFDVEEDRARGGRREGIEKVTTTPVSSSPIQMIRSFGLVPNDLAVLPPSTISSFSEQGASEATPPITTRQGLFNYSTLADDAAITESNLGFSSRGICDGSVLSMGALPTALILTKGSLDLLQGATNNDHNNDMSCRPLLDSVNVFGSVTKQSDENGSPYISVRPSRFPLGGHDAFNRLYSESLETTIRSEWDPSDTWTNGNEAFRFCKHCTIVPQIIPGEHTWNSSTDNSYVSLLEFKFPQGIKNFPSNNEKYVQFKTSPETSHYSSDANASEFPLDIYDPWYKVCMGGDSSTWWSNRATDGSGDGGECDASLSGSKADQFRMVSAGTKFGFMFRLGADFENYTDHFKAVPDNMYSNTSDSNSAFVVWLRPSTSASPGGNNLWKCQAGVFNTSIGQTDGGLSMVEDTETLFELDLDDYGDEDIYHTLEVRMTGKKMSVYFDGESKYSNLDIDSRWTNLATTSEDLESGTTSFCHSAFIMESFRTIYFEGDFDDGGSNPGDAVRAHKRMRYWQTCDWMEREDPSIPGVTAYSASGNNEKLKRSDELRIRSLRWMESGTQLTFPRSTIVASGGKLFASQTQKEYVPVSNQMVLDPSVSVVSGIDYLQKAYFVDGSNYKIYDPSNATTVINWNASNGELPGGNGSTGLNNNNPSNEYDGNPRCSIITSWLGRVVLSGKNDDPANWFMSAVGDPRDWDYISGDVSTGAVQGTSTSKFGQLGTPITAIIPSSGTTLLVAGLNNLHVLTGDPLWDQSQQQAISLDVGVVGQYAWCYGPNKSIYFMSENGLHLLEPNDFNVEQTDRLSAGKFDKTFGNIAFDSVNTYLAYDYLNHGVHIFLGPTSTRAHKVSHYFYDRRSNSFWPMEFPGVIGPCAIHDFRTSDPESRQILLGGYDGHLRRFSEESKTDDGALIDSYVWFGPVMTRSLTEAKLTELVAVLDEQSPDVNYDVYVADTVEAAKVSDPVYSSSWGAGRNDSRRLRARGAAVFIKLYDKSNNLPWVVEKLTAVMAVAGRVRKR